MALAVPNPPTTPRRVKVYELRNNDWYDRGTGYCTGQLLNDEPHIQVKSEEESDRVLLSTKIIKDDGYQKQQETLIVWTEPQGTDMALSFQEPEGCAAIWEFVSHVQSHLLSISGTDEILSDDAGDQAISSLVQLPIPELGNLAEIEIMMRQASSTVQGRDALAKYIISEQWVAKLVPILEIAEDLESLENLHRLCNIMKMVILLNDTVIVESIVSDEMVIGVVGILEYDPDFPSHKANHRQFLSDRSKFKEVVPIRDPEVAKKIHQTYRLQYLKDVVLARILDDPTFSVLNSLIFFNQFDILQHLQNNTSFMKELFSIFHSEVPDPLKRKHGIQFIQNCCQIAKTIQAQARAQLYQNFVQNGLFAVIDQSLLDSDPTVRVAATDVLVAMIDHDPGMMRAFIYRQINEKQKPLTHTLIELLLGEQDLGVKAQIADAMRVLLDHAQGPSMEMMGKAGGDMAARMHARTGDSDSEGFLKSFYEDSAKKLFQPLRELSGRESLKGLSLAEVSLYSHLVETLCFFVRQHSYRSKYFLLTENLPSRVAQLLGSPEKHLKLTALKFFRTCVGLQDEFYIRHMVKYKLFGPILDIIIETMPRDNLLNSACLEFFEFIRRENIKYIITHLVDTYRETMQKITYVKTFIDLIIRYEQNHEPPQPNRYTEPQFGAQRQTNGGRRYQGIKDMDADEEVYFATSDDEDKDEENVPPSTTPADVTPVKILNGSPPPVKPLVDYADDDEDEDMDDGSKSKTKSEGGADENAPPTPTTPEPSSKPKSEEPAIATPPESLAKRRREEDDDEDDVLGKLSKKRSPSPGGSNGIMRKRSFGLLSGTAGQGPPKKIAISLTTTNKEGLSPKSADTPTTPTTPSGYPEDAALTPILKEDSAEEKKE
ncbi:component of IIS longevity pathway SMK-1-domain-containing protein [Geopyxis carbonaria]|nr:component of IIS longevity pathway SMK-1-domain-containing protein [Geopyxis carbonaria]